MSDGTITLSGKLRHHLFMLSHAVYRWRRVLRRLPAALRWACAHDCRIIAYIHRVERYPHSWFVGGEADRILFEDASGVLWWRACGVLRPDVKTWQDRDGVRINALGGMSWKQSGKYFICEHATCWAEVERAGSWGPSVQLEAGAA